MRYKKVLICIFALLAVAAALYGVWAWQEQTANQPIRQQQEIR